MTHGDANSGTPEADDVSRFRLSNNVLPVHYDLHYDIHELEKTTKRLRGFVRITFELLFPRKKITLNAQDLNFSFNAVLTARETDKFLDVTSTIELDEDNQTATFIFSNVIPRGTYTLRVPFSAKVNAPDEDMHGIYRSHYKLPDGTERVMLTTQFEATHARKAFPCFDDPAQKATFALSLLVPADRTALSNTGVAREIFMGNLNLKRVSFEMTPVMSTYLLAFVVGDLEYLESQTEDGVRVRMYCTPGKRDKLEFALKTAVRGVEWLGNYFDVSYKNSMTKLDMVAVPDFAAGAMENWGLITYRELALLIDPTESSISARRRVAQVVLHELSHQWFGNLVTMEWWSNLWLNESFATFMAYKVSDDLFPEWNVWEDFVAQLTSGGKSLAALKAAHPIEMPVKNPTQIDQIFDEISYNMGGSVLRMLENWLGEKDFRDGLRLYLKCHAYGNARTEDLWQALEKVSGYPVHSVMDSWIKQVGYPLISVKPTEFGVILRQQRFLLDGSSAQDNDALWQIPISGITEDGNLVKGFFAQREVGISPVGARIVRLNPESFGFYRTHYDSATLDWFRFAIARKELSVIDRLILGEDLYSLLRSGHVGLKDYFDFVKAYESEDNYNVWQAVVSGLGTLLDIFSDTEETEDIKALGRRLLMHTVKDIGWKAGVDEPEETSLLRPVILGAASHFADRDVIDTACELFESAGDNMSSLDSNLRSVIFRAVCRYGNEATLERVKWLIWKTEDMETKIRLIQSLSCFTDREVLHRALEYAVFNPDRVRPQDLVYVFMAPVENKPILWQFIKDNWQIFIGRFGKSRMIGSIVGNAISGVSSEEHAADVERFFEVHPTEYAEKVVRENLETIRSRARFKERNRKALIEYFNG